MGDSVGSSQAPDPVWELQQFLLAVTREQGVKEESLNKRYGSKSMYYFYPPKPNLSAAASRLSSSLWGARGRDWLHCNLGFRCGSRGVKQECGYSFFTLFIVCLTRPLLCVPAPRYWAQSILPAISIHGQLSRTNATNRFYFEGHITHFRAPAEKALYKQVLLDYPQEFNFCFSEFSSPPIETFSVVPQETPKARQITGQSQIVHIKKKKQTKTPFSLGMQDTRTCPYLC